jgi:PTS system nitrogen regulatory IIA component
MRLGPLLAVETIEDSLAADSGEAVLAELAALLFRAGHVPEGTELVRILQNREELGSTGLGDGVAIPHVYLKNISSPRIAVGRSREGIEFNAIDGRPVQLFFLLVTPETAKGDHLKALGRISRLLRREEFRESLMNAKGPEEILRITVEEDEQE